MTTLRARGWREYNPMLLIAVGLLLMISIPIAYSTTIGQNGQFLARLGSPFVKHLIWICLGLVGLVAMSLFDYQALPPLAVPAYVGAVVALVAVLAMGVVRGGAQSWLGSSTLSFQPTEPAKIVLIIALAVWWYKHEDQAGSWRVLLGSLVIVAPLLGLVLLQPDFGSAMVMVGIWLIMAVMARTRVIQFVALGLVTVPVAIYAWLNVLQDYQRWRLMVFLFPERCLTDAEFARYCWQTNQAQAAIGNGGLAGLGLNRGVQNQLGYLPVPESDFVFTVTAEELGFIGAAIVILLELIVIWQIWRVVHQSHDSLGRLLATGIGAMILVHCWENIGMNLNIMPMTGIPLPLMSVGGSFMLSTLSAIGLVQSISLRQRRWSPS